MKTLLGSRSPWLLAWAASLQIIACTRAYGQANAPAMSSIHPEGTNVVVEVSVPSGFHRISLQTKSRLGSGAWVPVAVGQNDGSAKTMKFKLARSSQAELIRVQADTTQALPTQFYSGASRFTGPLSSSGTGLEPGGGVSVNGAGGATPENDGSRAVVESDIWKIDGDKIYFFNQYRGLQLIDIRDPDKAFVAWNLDLPAAGEQMYLADSNHVVLLANGPCGSSYSTSAILVIDVSGKQPSVVTNIGVSGWIQDSRMVGSALYVATQASRPVPNTTNTVWEWGTQVSSFDLSVPDKPLSQTTLWFSGYGNVVSATDTYLFVAMQDSTDWWRSTVQLIDVTAPDGTMSAVSSIRASGRIADKFKINYTNNVLTTISEDWRWNTTTGLVTRLETFRLPDPRSVGPGAITRLGELELGSGERLQATRFDGDLAYVVTFFQIDPLWVIDLSDPANPAMVGSVEVPGWSTYIAPMGDRLVTVGVESNRVAVSLFDVHSPAQPSLLDRVLLGPGYSWSEAISDEKAFTVLPDLGLVLVPYDGATTNGWTSRVQLLDLTRTNLVARGIIQHQCQARRTAFAQNRVLSISGWELLSVDIADRDNPLVKGDSQLAWPVDRVFAQGDYLIELSSSSGWWGFQAPPGIRITPAHQPDTILNTLPLTNLPVVGAALKNDKLYIAQSPNGYYMVQPAGGPGGGALTNGPDFYLTVIDAAHLPDLTVLGQASTFAGVGGWGAQWSPAWTSDNILVWIGGGFNWWIRAYPLGPGGVAIGVIWPWWGTSGGQLLAFDVGNPAQPMFDSNVDLRTNGWTGFSAPAVSGPRVYLSHSEYFLATNSIYTNGVWSETHYLDVVDYTDPLNPTLRPPVNIPGDLQGISNQGELLYTTGYHWDPNTAIDWTQWLDASAYDGVSAHLVDSLALSNYWALPVIADTNVFISNGDYYWLATNPAPASIEAWSLSGTGRFTLNGSVMLNQLATKLFEYHGLLASREIDGSLEVFKDTDPNALVRVGYDSPSSCVWYDLSLGDSRPGDALWLPLGAFGVKQVNLGP